MKVKELISKLGECNPEAEVLFHEYMEMDSVCDMDFSRLRFVTAGFAMDEWMESGNNEITIYEASGVHDQGYKITTPVVALSQVELNPADTNASVRVLSGFDKETIDRLNAICFTVPEK